MKDFITEFISAYGMEILYAVFMAIAGFLGLTLKNLYQKHVNDDTKKAVVKTCVQAVEQLYSDLHGEEKFNKAVTAATEMLAEKGIKVTELELEMLIEAAVGEFNNVFNSTEETAFEDAKTDGTTVVTPE